MNLGACLNRMMYDQGLHTALSVCREEIFGVHNEDVTIWNLGNSWEKLHLLTFSSARISRLKCANKRFCKLPSMWNFSKDVLESRHTQFYGRHQQTWVLEWLLSLYSSMSAQNLSDPRIICSTIVNTDSMTL